MTPVYIKYPEWVNPKRQTEDQQLSMGQKDGEGMVTGIDFFIG